MALVSRRSRLPDFAHPPLDHDGIAFPAKAAGEVGEVVSLRFVVLERDEDDLEGILTVFLWNRQGDSVSLRANDGLYCRHNLTSAESIP